MSKKLYGNLMNRLEEGKNYTGREIKVGDDITMYHYSDRTCYWVTGVVDQKHITVARYQVCADRDKEGGMGHQDWMYFHTIKEESDYLEAHGCERLSEDEDSDKISEEKWVYRYNRWCEEYIGADDKKHYLKLPGNISFGVRDYYFDWEF